MLLTKVMAIDDEVLALDYIESLISWPDTRYRLVAKATNAKDALQLFLKEKPTVILADISMPDINGISLMKKILEFDIPVRFIFLTAYREFQYVQEALRQGASDYLLKHDLTPSTLLAELDKAADSLRVELQNHASKHETAYREQCLVGIARPDTIYPIVGGGDATVYAPPWEPIRCIDFSRYQAVDYVEILDNSKNEFVFLCYLKSSYRYQMLESDLRKLTSDIQQIFRETAGCCVSLAFSPNPCRKNQRDLVVEKLISLISLRFFFGKEQCLMLGNQVSDGQPVNQSEVDELFSLLNQNGGYLDQLQALLDRTRGSIDAFDVLVRALVIGIDRQRGELSMPSLIELNQMGILQRELWYDFNGVKSWFCEQFSLLEKELKARSSGESASKARQALLLIEQNYFKDISLDYIAQKMGISAVYLIKILKQQTGKTFMEFLTEYRIEVAKCLLIEKKYKIRDLAEKVGYHSGQYFSTVFKKQTGCTPQEFRTKYKGKFK